MHLGTGLKPFTGLLGRWSALTALKSVYITEDEMTLTAASKSAMLDELASVVTHFSLHTADPGASGVSEVSGGSYARVAASWASASDVSVSTTGSVTFTVPSGTPTHVGFWSASSGGTFYGSAVLESPRSVTAGSFVVPTVTVFLDAGQVVLAAGQSSDELRLLLHDGGLLQAPLSVDPDTRVFWQGKNAVYDSEQGGFPLDLPATSTSKALAIACTQSARSMWFGERADGTAVLALNQSTYATASATFPALSSASRFVIEGSFAGPLTGSASQFLCIRAGSFLVYLDPSGNLSMWDGSSFASSASSVSALVGVGDWGDFEWRLDADGTSHELEVRVPGGTWVSSLSRTGASISPAGGTLTVGSNTTSDPFRGSLQFLRVRDGGPLASVAAAFTPGLFVAGNRGDGATATDAYGVTWTLTRPAATALAKVIVAGERRFVLPGVSGENLSVARGAGVTTTEIAYTGTDGAVTTVTTSADPVVVGDAGEWVSIELRDGVGGAAYDTLDPADADPDASTFVSSTSGQTVTINRTTAANYHLEVAEADVAAIQFDGVDDYADVVGDGAAAAYAPGSGLTVAVDGRLHSATSFSWILGTAGSETGPNVRRWSTDSRLYGYIFDGSSALFLVGNGSDNITQGDRFVFVVAAVDADQAAYVGGASVATSTSAAASAVAASGEVRLGRGASGGASSLTLFAAAVVADRLDDADVATVSQELLL